MKAFLTRKFLKLPVWLWLSLVLFIAGGALAYQNSRPVHGSWAYGACRAILEQYVRFPASMDIEEGGQNGNTVIIVYSDLNPFGSRQVRLFECYYTREANGKVKLSRLTVDRKALAPAITERFNQMLPVLTSIELDTALPKDLPDDLEDLKE